MARVRIRVEGLRELEQALLQLPRATGKNVLRRTLMKAGEPIEADAEARAPKLSGRLQRSHAIGTRLNKNQRRRYRKQSPIEVHVGVGEPSAPVAHLQEFGSARHAPQRFLTPAWDANHRRALDSIKSDLGNEIEKARARLARKAARAARKLGK